MLMDIKHFPLGLGTVCALAVVLLALFYVLGPASKVAAPSVTIHQPSVPTPTAEQCTAKLPDSFLVGQVLIVGMSGQDLAARVSFIKQFSVGGVVLTSAPVDPYDGSIQAFKTDAANLNVPPL